MASSYICPHCGKSVTVKTVPIENCPHCGEQVPDALADEIENNFTPVRPWSLSFQLYFGLFVGTIMLIMIQYAFQPADDSIYKMLNMPAPPHLPPMASGILVCIKTFFLLWSSYSLYMQEYKSRMILMLMVFVFTVPETVMMAFFVGNSDLGRYLYIMSSVFSVISLGLAYWYLYYWKKPKTYYENLRYLEAKAQMNAERSR
jgi:hypothetical protein